MKKYTLISIFLFLMSVNSIAQENLNYEKEFIKEESDYYFENGYHPLFNGKGLTGTLSVKNYVLLDDIYIAEDELLTIQGGTKIFFKGNKKIIVKGRLQLLGEAVKQITISNIPTKISYDGIFNKDHKTNNWDGIYIDSSGIVEISFTKMGKSNYGIVTSNTDKLKHVDNCSFPDNKYSDIKVGEKEVNLDPGYYSNDKLIKIVNDHMGIKNKKEISKNRIILHIISSCVFVAGGTMAIVCELKHEEQYDLYEDEKYSKESAKTYYNSAEKYRNLRNAGIVIAGAGVIGFSIAFAF